VVELGFQGKL